MAQIRNNVVPVPFGGVTGRGQSLPTNLQRQMENRLGQDFSDVKVHQGPHAQQIGAQAFAHGNNLHFAPGQYQPTTSAGRELIAHELTHVVQQGAASPPRGGVVDPR